MNRQGELPNLGRPNYQTSLGCQQWLSEAWDTNKNVCAPLKTVFSSKRFCGKSFYDIRVLIQNSNRTQWTN